MNIEKFRLRCFKEFWMIYSFFKKDFTVDIYKGSESDCNLLLKQRQERFIDLPY